MDKAPFPALAFALLFFLVSPFLASAQTYTPKGVGGGGAMSGFSISPYSDLWFVGTDMGTLYRSDNEGVDWQPVSHFQTTFSNDLPNAAYLGFNPDTNVVFHAYEGCKPQRSTDGGITWTTITSLQNLMPTGGYDFADCKNDANPNRIRYWLSDSQDENIVFAAGGDRLYRSADKGITWAAVAGITGEGKGTFIDYSTNPHSVYHAIPTGIYRSTDGGLNFSLYHATNLRGFTGGRDANGITLAYIDTDETACSSDYSNRYGGSNLDCGYIWIEKNGGGFVQKSKTGGDWIRMAENDSETIYTTGARVWNLSYGTQIWVSRDAGDTWTQKLQQLLTSPLPYHPWDGNFLEWSAVGLDIGYDDAGYRSFAINRRDASQAGGTGNYFLHVTKDYGDHWLAPFTEYADTGTRAEDKRWRTKGLDPTSAWLLEFHPNNPDVGYVGYADIGGLCTEDGGDTWRIIQATYNSIYDVAFDPSDDRVVFAAVSSLHDFPYEWYGNYTYAAVGGIYKSTDRGRNWTRLTPDAGDFNMAFLSVAYDAKNHLLYGGTQGRGVAVSSDGGGTWSWLNGGLGTQPKIIPQIEIDPANQDLYVVMPGDKPDFTDISLTGMYKLPYGTTNWQHMRGTVHDPPHPIVGPLWKYPVHFQVDWNDPTRQKIWLTDIRIPGMYRASGIWLTEDGGTNWYQKNESPNPHRITLDPCDPNRIYVNGLGGDGVTGGPMYSTDYGNTWQRNMDLPLQNNLSSLTVDPNDPHKVFYSAFGGGMLHGDKPAATPNCADPVYEKKVFAHYLPWYDSLGVNGQYRAGWCYEGDCTDLANFHYSHKPLIGEYSQLQTEVLEYHLLLAHVAGIDGFIINLNPTSSLQTSITTQLLNKINELQAAYANFDFDIIISYDNNWAAAGTDITNDLTYIRDNIYRNPLYESLIYRENRTGKQVLQTWSEVSPSQYYSDSKTLFGTDEVLLMVRNAVSFDYSDGNFGWIGYMSDATNQSTNWGEGYYEDFDWISARQPEFGLTDRTESNHVKMGAVYPGFDDQNTPNFWNGGVDRLIERNVAAGSTMSLTWDKNISYTPHRLGGYNRMENPWIQICTWNDWPEGTSIEPATEGTYGYSAIFTNRDKIVEFQQLDDPTYTAAYPDDVCMYVPYQIHQARVEGREIDADFALDLLMLGQCEDAYNAVSPVPLPVELLAFDAECEGREVGLSWESAGEEGFSHYVVEQSRNGVDFHRTAEVRGQGGGLYQHTASAEKGLYFRLRMVDSDGSVEYSEVIRTGCDAAQLVLIFPNPTKGALYLDFPMETAGEARVRIVDMLGRTVLHATLAEGDRGLDVGHLPAGHYALTVDVGRKILGGRFVKQ